MLFVFANDEDWRRAQAQLVRIGYDRAEGFVRGGFTAWQDATLPVDRLHSISIEELRPLHQGGAVTVVDVRQDPEFAAGHVPDAVHIPLGLLPARLGDVPADGRRVATMCASGTRATIAASILRRVGYDPLVVTNGGFDEWAAHKRPVSH